MFDHDPLVRLDVEVLLHGVVIARGRADRLRKDVKDAGFGDGSCGFRIPIPSALSSHDPGQVVVRPRGVNAYLVQQHLKRVPAPALPAVPEPLPEAPVSVPNREPRLWVDRADWFDVLSARHRRGLLPDEVADQIARFVRDGVIVMRRALSPWLADLVDRSIEAARQAPPDGLRLEGETANGAFNVMRAASGPLSQDATLVDLHAFSAAVRTALASPAVVALFFGLFGEAPMLTGLRTVLTLSAAVAGRACAARGSLGAIFMLGRHEEGQGALGYRLGSHQAAESQDGSMDLSSFPLRRLMLERGDLAIWHPDLVLTEADPREALPGPALLASYAPVSAAVEMKALAYPMQESHGCQFVSQYHPIRTLI